MLANWKQKLFLWWGVSGEGTSNLVPWTYAVKRSPAQERLFTWQPDICQVYVHIDGLLCFCGGDEHLHDALTVSDVLKTPEL